MNVQLTAGEWLRDIVEDDLHLTQDEFALAVGVGQSTVSSWMKDKTRPRRRQCPAIARVTGIPLDEVHWRFGYQRRQEVDLRLVEGSGRSEIDVLFASLPPTVRRAMRDLMEAYRPDEEGD